MMMSLSKWCGVVVAFGMLAGSANAADAVSGGKVKSVNAEKMQFVLTDNAGKDWTIKLGDEVVFNRGGKESKSDLKVDDQVSVAYEKGTFTWTAHYILVQEGDSKNCELMSGTVKGYDGDKKEVTFTDLERKDRTFLMGDAKVRLNAKDSKAGEMKIGDPAIAIVETKGDKMTLKSLMIQRK